MMSYFDQTENTFVDANFAFLISPMVADWIALGNKYGMSAVASSGNTTWGFNTNVGSTVFANLAAYADDTAFEPAFLEIMGQEGQMRFIAVTAWLDIRYDARAGGPIAEFSWEGSRRGRSTIRPRVGCAWNRRPPRRPRLFPYEEQLRLRVRALLSSSTAC